MSRTEHRAYRIHRRSYVSNGRRRTSPTYSIDFRDHRGRSRRLAGFKTRDDTTELARHVIRLVRCAERYERPDSHLVTVMKAWPDRIRKRLLEWGVVDAQRDAETRPLVEHVDDWRQHLQAKGNTERHVKQVSGRVLRLLKGAGLTRWSAITTVKVERWLKRQREDRHDTESGELIKRGISAQTWNFYVTAIRQFCRWMVSEGRAAEAPLGNLTTLNVRTDRRHDRRALTIDELRRLLETTHKGPERAGLDGPTRALAYRLAAETGLRASEVRSLTRASFCFDGKVPTVAVKAGYSKRRREDVLPLRPDTAALLQQHMEHLAPAAQPFPLPRRDHMGRDMWRPDLKVAAIEYRDEETDKVVDFHSLRHTFITNLAASGVHPKTAQALARHSTITLTMDRYSHSYHDAECEAVTKLPDLNAATCETSNATGTDGSGIRRREDADFVRRFVRNSSDTPRTTMDRRGVGSARKTVRKNLVTPLQDSGLRGYGNGEGGIRLAGRAQAAVITRTCGARC